MVALKRQGVQLIRTADELEEIHDSRQASIMTRGRPLLGLVNGGGWGRKVLVKGHLITFRGECVCACVVRMRACVRACVRA